MVISIEFDSSGLMLIFTLLGALVAFLNIWEYLSTGAMLVICKGFSSRIFFGKSFIILSLAFNPSSFGAFFLLLF